MADALGAVEGKCVAPVDEHTKYLIERLLKDPNDLAALTRVHKLLINESTDKCMLPLRGKRLSIHTLGYIVAVDKLEVRLLPNREIYRIAFQNVIEIAFHRSK